MLHNVVALVLALSVGQMSMPKITGLLPERIVTSPKPQQITVSGQEFRPNLTLIVTTPGGQARTMSGAEIVGVTPTSFRASVTFDAAGAYEFVVTNADGGRSAPFRADVRPGRAAPSIDRVTPAEASRGPEPQVLTLRGSNFENGLKVSLTDPTGTVSVKDAFDRIEPTTVVLRVAFEVSGTYAVMVTNPSGETSNTVSITIR